MTERLGAMKVLDQLTVRGHQASFVDVAQPGRFPREVGAQELHGDAPPEGLVGRRAHLPHAAVPDALVEVVAPHEDAAIEPMVRTHTPVMPHSGLAHARGHRGKMRP